MIWAFKFNHHGQANTKIEFKGYQISIAMDDSCGTMEHYSRTDIRIYHGDSDVTENFNDVLQDSCLRSSDDLFNVMLAIHEEHQDRKGKDQ
jgi:hypothetical protein